MFNEKMILNNIILLLLLPSTCLGLIVLENKKYICAPIMLQAMCIVDNA